MNLQLPPLPHAPSIRGPVVLCVLDGVGLGLRDSGDAVHLAHTPTLDALWTHRSFTSVQAHGTAVGLPSDGDMGNSEVGHNALGAGRVFQQGASLVERGLADGSAFAGDVWPWLIDSGTLHLLGLLSDGNVHSHIRHLLSLLERAAQDGVERVRVHALTDGRDVHERSALTYIRQLEQQLQRHRAQGLDYRLASGGGRMHMTLDRYEADWPMVKRGWDCHVHGHGRHFTSGEQAIQALYDEDPKVNDQWLPAFVIVDDQGAPLGRIRHSDAVLLFNFRGDRAIEISKAFEGRPVPFDRGDEPPKVRFAGMMQYDGDEQVPQRYLVAPPVINRTVGEHLAANGRRSYAVSETQKFGHVTFFFNGNRSGLLDEEREEYHQVPSRNVPFEQIPEMEARAITQAAVTAIGSGRWDHVRLNLANGDMVGHSGDLNATIQAMQVLDECVAQLIDAVNAARGVMIVTADHGNADDMVQRTKAGAPKRDADGRMVPRTSHSLNPVPFALVDASESWELTGAADAGLANIGTTLLALCGLTPPDDFVPALLRPRS